MSVTTEALQRLPELWASHVRIVAAALAAAIVLAIPLVLLARAKPRFGAVVLGCASLVQTIPGLALLALMVPLLGTIGFWPAFCALVLYALLPILRNGVTGLAQVDANVVDAARGLGMTDSQTLRQVELPLALPVLVAGVRTAAVWTVGMATLATLVGWRTLGNFIFSGLQTQNFTIVLFGCGAAALTALAVDGALASFEWAARTRRPRWMVPGGLALIVAVVCSYLLGQTNSNAFRFATKAFTEQRILAEWFKRSLNEAERDVVILDGMGTQVAFQALVRGDIDSYVEYTGTLWADMMLETKTASREATLRGVTDWLKKEHQITVLGRLGFENAYCIAMHRPRAEALNIRTLDDLARKAGQLTLATDIDFPQRPEWPLVRDAYNFAFNMDVTLLYSAVAEGAVDAITAYSTDGRIAAMDLVILSDPRLAFPPYDAVLLLSADAAKDNVAVDVLRKHLGTVDADRMRRTNANVDVEGKSLEAAATTLWEK